MGVDVTASRADGAISGGSAEAGSDGDSLGGAASAPGIEVRVRGRVQGVGFRPTVWKLARELGVTGEVMNDGDGVLIRAGGAPNVLATFVARLSYAPPPLARVEIVETRSYRGELAPEFRIVASAGGAARTQIAPDAAICAACAAEVLDPLGRRYRYPFTTCTHCGPRLSIVTGIPYDRAATTLAGFPLCAPCAAEYGDPADRRFHAETTACHACGPRARLVRYDGRAVSFEQFSMLDDVDAVRGLLARGEIVAIKGLGGYHLACDATRPDAVARLRAAKHRDAKPLALMARSLDVIRRYCATDAVEAAALASPEAPIVVLAATGPEALPAAIAPGLATLGFMLPTTPLHHLILRALDRPVVMTRGEAILSQHQGDLDDPATHDDYQANLARYTVVFEHEPRALAVDRHVEFRSSRLARDHAAATARPVFEVQHHHAHVAACLVDNARALAAPPVLGVVLDGLGLGDDGTLWGGEFLLADYRRAQRLGTLKPVAMLGGDRAAHEPWRNLYAHLAAELGWPAFTASFAELAVHAELAGKPRPLLDAMLASGVGAPRASSCGRLFDAVAAAVGICFERQAYEGEAAARLEAAVDPRALDEGDELAYPFAIPRLGGSGLPYLEPLAMWSAILGDLILATPVGVIAARFHRGLARTVAQMVGKLAGRGGSAPARFDTVALSGGCFQNRVLFEQCARRLRGDGFTVLGHARVPVNDGGLALGQAAVCAAQLLDSPSPLPASLEGCSSCV